MIETDINLLGTACIAKKDSYSVVRASSGVPSIDKIKQKLTELPGVEPTTIEKAQLVVDRIVSDTERILTEGGIVTKTDLLVGLPVGIPLEFRDFLTYWNVVAGDVPEYNKGMFDFRKIGIKGAIKVIAPDTATKLFSGGLFSHGFFVESAGLFTPQVLDVEGTPGHQLVKPFMSYIKMLFENEGINEHVARGTLLNAAFLEIAFKQGKKHNHTLVKRVPRSLKWSDLVECSSEDLCR